MSKEVLVWCECYANKCFAERLFKAFEGKQRLLHSEKLGRDRILSKVLRAVRGVYSNTIHILVIDYEVGVARVFVEKQFKIEGALIEGPLSKLYVARHYRYSNVYAIIFDPNIEAFLVEHVSAEIEHYKREIKSSRACDTLRRFLETETARRVTSLVAEKIRSLLSGG